ncbi:MAG: hypothetical protein ABSB60_16335 [Terracidiphilus sp.]|jgi:membrane protein YdbS with pleckstrin-like domain
MKTITTTISVVLLLSTLIWVAVYFEFPEAPLRPRETVLIVFLCTIATTTVQFVWKRRRSRQTKEIHETHK